MVADLDYLIDTAEYVGVTYSTNYSGRGMYGAECFAIYGNHNSLIKFLRALDEDTADDLSGPAIDNMGLDLVLYWSSIKTKDSEWL